MLGPFARRDVAQEVCREWANETLGGVPPGVSLFVSANRDQPHQKAHHPPPHLTVKMVKNHMKN